MITVRKIKLTIMGDKDTRNSQYKWIRDEQYNQYRALNMGMTYLAVNDILYMNESGLEIRTIKDLKDCEKDIDKNKKEIEKLTARLEKEQNKKNSSSEKLDEIKYKISLVENKIEDYKLKIVELRSEEHTSELQSRQYLVCRLLLEKKNKHSIERALCTPGVLLPHPSPSVSVRPLWLFPQLLADPPAVGPLVVPADVHPQLCRHRLH